MITSLYAGGMTVRDIGAHLARTIGTDLEPRYDSDIPVFRSRDVQPGVVSLEPESSAAVSFSASPRSVPGACHEQRSRLVTTLHSGAESGGRG